MKKIFLRTTYEKLMKMDYLPAFFAQQKTNVSFDTIKLDLSHKHSTTTVLRMQKDF